MMKMNVLKKSGATLLAMMCMLLQTTWLSAQNTLQENDYVAYLFTYFTGNHISQEQVCYAVSMDGYHYKALNQGKPVLDSKVISSTGGVRDPHIVRSQDGRTFYMVLTDMVSGNGWDSNRALVMMKSDDLVNWKHSVINMQKRYTGQEALKRVWAPQTIYDAAAGKYMVYWSMKHADGPDIIYYAYANNEFTDLEGEPKPLFIPKDKLSCIDGDIVLKDGTYYMFYKTEGHGNGIKLATTRKLSSGEWTEYADYKQLTTDPVEGAGTFKLIGQDKYILMYDVYTKHRYQFTETTDLMNFKTIDSEVSMDFHPRHGTIIPITADELKRLIAQWGAPEGWDGSMLQQAAQEEAQSVEVAGPDGKLLLKLALKNDGKATYTLTYNGKTMLQESPLGMVTNVGDFSKGLTWKEHRTSSIDKTYKQDRIKKSEIRYQANELVCSFENRRKQIMEVTFRVSNNDVAMKYTLLKTGETGSVRVMEEMTGFQFPDYTTTFLTPQSDAMIGWKRTKPSYEEGYKADAPMNEKSGYGHGYTFPCLFKVGNDGWVLVSETGVDSKYAASHLSDAVDGLYTIAYPMPEENNGIGTIEPAIALPGSTPWRTITVGETLAPIVETTIPWDVVEPRYETTRNYQMGRGTWSWILWQDGSINYDDQVKYIDLASAMGFEYVLVDNWWDTYIGRERIADLVKYANSKNVDVFLWYSSSGYWNDIEQGPINRMDNSIIRKREMRWLESIGVKGIKVDFFGGDKQMTMQHYEEILSDADDHGLMVIFHGCTLPRGWERMYPNYVGSEAVLASENLVFGQHACNMEAFNATLHPFIRNTVGCMEFGGTFLNRRLNRGNDGGTRRRTTDVFELATAVLFQNPIQNFALAPNNLTDAPQVCLDFMKQVPTTWDDVKLIDGYPGKYIVLARRHGQQWYVAAINATKEPLKLNLDLPMLADKQVNYYSDAADSEPQMQTITLKKGKANVTIQPNGGAVWVQTNETDEKELSAYLFTYFKDETHGLYFALSDDGYTFTDVNGGNPIIAGDTIAQQKGIRDPYIYRAPDGTFYIAMTDLHIYAKQKGYRTTEWERDGMKYGWGNNRGFVFMKSTDLINWKHCVVRLDELFDGYDEIGCAWAPELIYDERKGRLMIYFTMRMGNQPNKLYYAYVNEAFDGLETRPELLYEYPDTSISAIDADITKVGDTYHMFYVAHDGTPGIKHAVSKYINRGYQYLPEWIDPEPHACEAPMMWKRIGQDKWVVMYDIYGIQPHNFGFSETTDFKHFEHLGHLSEGVMKATNFTSPKHGAVIRITKKEAAKLKKHWK